MRDARMTAEPGKIVGGKYRLEKPLAKGGMGSVWLARHTELDAPVAVKFMAHELVGTPVAELRFKREAKAAAQLRSPHVVHIHDYGVEDGAPYMVMELLDGEDLAGEIARAGKLAIGRVAAIVAQVAKALSLAHAAGIVHRDLKPSNLFLARSGEDEIVKVLDFGVAKETMTTLVVDKTTSGTLVGSPQYMSPEQARGEAVDLKSDLWSLGVLVFEALTGRPPFESTHLGALLAKIHEANAPAPTSLAPELPQAIDRFMARALARAPSDRFASARALADELSAIAGGAGAAANTTAPRTTITVEPAQSIVGRMVDTLPANEPAPVSTTMHEREAPPKDEGGRRSRAIVAAALVAVVGGAVAIGWLGFGGGQPGGTDAAGSGDRTAPATGVTTAAALPSTTVAPERPAPGDPTSTGSVAQTATALAPSTAVPASATASTAQPSTAQPSTAQPSTAQPSTARPATSGAPARPPSTSPSATAGTPGTATPTVTRAPTAAPVSTPTPPAHDPVFGL